ncbi:hypothetical protein Tco_0901341, partial [Tanacetum coccineum]
MIRTRSWKKVSDVEDVYDETAQYMAIGDANDASFLKDVDNFWFEFLKYDKKNETQIVDEGSSQKNNYCPKWFHSRCATSFGSKRRIKSVSSSSDGRKGVKIVTDGFQLAVIMEESFRCGILVFLLDLVFNVVKILLWWMIANVEEVQNRSDWIKELAGLDRIDALDATQKEK